MLLGVRHAGVGMPRVVVLGGGVVGLSTGVRLADGSELQADLVIDAMGRRSPLPGWLADIGARKPAEEAEDSGFIYYTRYFRPKDGAEPPPFLTGLLIPFECFSLLTLPSDAGTWSVTVFVSTHDPALKEIRHPDNWQAVVAACPLHAHLLNGDLITDVIAMGGVLDRYRRYVIEGSPVETGVLSVREADLFRAFIEIVEMLAMPQQVLARPGMTDRIAAVAAEHEEVVIPGPTRADVLASL
jgi:hypothetical protein